MVIVLEIIDTPTFPCTMVYIGLMSGVLWFILQMQHLYIIKFINTN